MSWWKSKWSIAAHIALVYCGTTFYVQSLIRQEREKQQRSLLLQQTTDATGADDTPSLQINSHQQQQPQLQQRLKKKQEIQEKMDKNWLIKYSREKFMELAPSYDQALKWDELVMGLPLIRRFLLRHAQGDVLEVACGTGRNIPYYPGPDKLKSVTFIDQSYPMLQETVKKFDEYQHRFQINSSANSGFLSSFFKSSGDDEEEIPSQFIHVDNLTEFPDDSFDTVIDTFGLCSIGAEYGPLHPSHPHPHQHDSASQECTHSSTHPIQFLNELARVCKPNGQILLLEHGRSTYDYLNRQLDNGDMKHFEKWGCWWNRDLVGLLGESELEVVDMYRWHFGTTLYVIARPKSEFKQRRRDESQKMVVGGAMLEKNRNEE